jgi:alpha-glucosidase
MLHWRKSQPALEAGRLEHIETQNTVLAFSRYYGEYHLLCVFNISDQPSHYDLAHLQPCEAVIDLGFDVSLDGNQVLLPPYGVFFAHIKSDIDS